MKFKNNHQQIFVAPKVHSRVRLTRLVIEILFLILVIAGTIFTLALPSGFSFDRELRNVKDILSLKSQGSERSELPTEERIRLLVDKKLLTIASLENSGDDFMTIRSLEGVTVIISIQKDLEAQARTLQTLLSKAKIEGRAVSLVDFRFDKLVVRYK